MSASVSHKGQVLRRALADRSLHGQITHFQLDKAHERFSGFNRQQFIGSYNNELPSFAKRC
jgi:hypothetical protein